MTIFTPDLSLRYHVESFDVWNGHEVCQTTDSRDEALAWFEQALWWKMSNLCVTDTLKGITIAQHECPCIPSHVGRW